MKNQPGHLLRYAAVIFVGLLVTSTTALANRIDLFADQGMTQCSLVDDAPGLKSIYVFLTGTATAEAVYFSAPRPDCWQGATWVGDALPGPRTRDGNTQTSLFTTLIPPGTFDCRTPPVLVCTMFFLTNGQALPCCDLIVKGGSDPREPYPIEYFDCFIGQHPAAPGKVTINPNGSCPCSGPLAIESSTWGRVKSLYR
jgi:hypothetical protein